MQVRVFKSKDDYSDWEFVALPAQGHELEFADETRSKVEKVGHFEAEGKFLPAIWISKPSKPYSYDISAVS